MGLFTGKKFEEDSDLAMNHGIYVLDGASTDDICLVVRKLDLGSTTWRRCGDMVAVLMSRPLAAAFVRPVDPTVVPGYNDVVSKPMDLVREGRGVDAMALLDILKVMCVSLLCASAEWKVFMYRAIIFIAALQLHRWM